MFLDLSSLSMPEKREMVWAETFCWVCTAAMGFRASHPTAPDFFACLRGLQPSLKVREFWQDIEGNRPWWHRFRDQVDPVIRAVPKKMRGPIEMPHAIGIEAHQARTHEVRSNCIIGENELFKMPMSSV